MRSDKQPICIITAMPSEYNAVISLLPETGIESTLCGMNIFTCGDGTVIVACCGVGKVNAAICTQLLISKYNPKCIVSVGIAGGMTNTVKICDMVISKSVRYHDTDDRLMEKYHLHKSEFESEPWLVKLACDACVLTDNKFHIGRIVSGDLFLTNETVKKHIACRWTPLAIDMESAAIGQTAWQNGIPFVSLRCISDNADNNGVENYDEFEKAAAGKVAEAAYRLIEEIQKV